MDRFLHSIIACRVILDIREQASDEPDIILNDIQAEINDPEANQVPAEFNVATTSGPAFTLV